MTITPEDYHFLRKLIREKSGIELGDEKEYFVESRLLPALDKLCCSSINDLVNQLKHNFDPKTLCQVIDLMTTNESLFFRDGTPFELLKSKFLPELFEKRKNSKQIKIWSAACSTGQEPYSIAMTILSSGLCIDNWHIEILATDICSTALQRAKEGIYSEFELKRGLDQSMLDRFFIERPVGKQIKEEVRKMIIFQELNLVNPFEFLHKFDIIFCRNVLIYFRTETKKEVLKRLAKFISSDGILFLGGAETVLALSDEFEKMMDYSAPIFYKKQASET